MTAIYSLSLHDALPISNGRFLQRFIPARIVFVALGFFGFCLVYAYKVVLSMSIVAMVKSGHKSSNFSRDRKSTRLNSSHVAISYAVFCLKKKSNNNLHL